MAKRSKGSLIPPHSHTVGKGFVLTVAVVAVLSLAGATIPPET
jgi:hypothetical protein